MGRILFLILLIVEIGAAVGWIGVVVTWVVRQSSTRTTVMSPRHLYGVGLPIVAALAIVTHMAVDKSSRLGLWWIPLGWLVLAAVMIAVRRIQLQPRRYRHERLP